MYNNDHLFNFCNFNMKVASARKLINKQPEYYQIKRMKWIISVQFAESRRDCWSRTCDFYS